MAQGEINIRGKPVFFLKFLKQDKINWRSVLILLLMVIILSMGIWYLIKHSDVFIKKLRGNQEIEKNGVLN